VKYIDSVMRCAKSDEPFEMSFGLELGCAQRSTVKRGGGSHWRHMANTTELFICGGDAGCCQVTLTTCCRGATSVVYRCQHRDTKQQWAVKVITKRVSRSALNRPLHLLRFLANVNSRSRSLYAIARPSVCRLSSVVCLSSVCNVRALYSGN